MDHNKIQSEYWDKQADNIASININMSPIEIKEISDFFDFAGLDENSNILEIGCGAGRFTLPLLRMGNKVTGTDISTQSLENLYSLAKKYGMDQLLSIKKTDFAKPIFNEEFDLVIIGNVIHHFEPKKKDEIFANIIKSLKRGGKIAIFEPNAYCPFYLPLYLFWELSGKKKGIWKAEKGVFKSNGKNIKKILSNNGIKDIKLKRHTLIPLRAVRIIKNIYKINDFLIKIPILNNLSAYIWLRGEKTG